MSWSAKTKGFQTGSMMISGEEVPTRTGEMLHADLRFWVDNPRIYSIVHASGEPLDQDQIQLELQGRDHVKQLIQDIKHHGGLIHPVLVRDGKYEVLEGNSRLAAYRFLSIKEPTKYGKIRCTVLPTEIAEKLVYAYLNQEHIKGKSEWSPYEQAGVIYRLVNGGMEMEALSKELNLGPRVLKRMYDTYAFMVDNNEDKPARWSYYEVYLQNRKVQEKRNAEKTLDKRVIKEIRSGKVTAQQFRDMLPDVCSHPRAFSGFVSEKTNLLGAYEKLEHEGKTEDLAKMMRGIHQKVRGLNREDFDGLKPRAAKTVENEMRGIIRKLTSLKKKVFESKV